MKQITNYQNATIFDLETDGLLDTVSKIYICGFKMAGGSINVLWGDTELDRIQNMFIWHRDNGVPVACHNAITFDVPVLEKLLGIDLKGLMVIDTLTLSWYLNINHARHSLEVLGREYDVPEKFHVDEKDWKNLTKEQAVKRVTSDVAINSAVYNDFINRLEVMSGQSKKLIDDGEVGGKRTHPEEIIYLDSLVGLSVEEHVNRIISFLMAKTDVQRLQEKTGWLVDVPYLEENAAKLLVMVEEAARHLEVVMPKVPKYTERKEPTRKFKKSGEASVAGANWARVIQGVRDKEEDEYGNLLFVVRNSRVYELTSLEPPNINSPQQVKDFLFSKGWQPLTFKYVRDDKLFDQWIKDKPKKGAAHWEWTAWKDSRPEDRAIPQVRMEGEDGKELCESVEILAEQNPEINYLEEYSVIKHRLDTMNGILNRLDESNKVQASWQGFTNTLRVKHKAPITNLPAAKKKYAKAIRGSLIAPKGYVTCGSDLKAIEDRVKVMFMLPHDPEYATFMCSDDFDPHLVTAVAMGAIMEEQMLRYMRGMVEEEEEKSYIHGRREAAKPVNYLSVYGGTAKALMIQTGWDKERCEKAIDAYWEKNWSVKAIAAEQVVFVDGVKGFSWLINPINGFCYSVRSEKDYFSTLAQGTGSFFFDVWIFKILDKQEELWGRKTQTMSYHDEGAWVFRDTPKFREAFTKIIKDSIKEVSEEYLLRRELDADIQFARSYGDVH